MPAPEIDIRLNQAACLFEVIAFDADDTLWYTETLYRQVQDKFTTLLEPYLPTPTPSDQALYEIEMRNLPYFGYGIKGFTLSLIETAIELTSGTVPAPVIQQIIQSAKEMITSPIRLLNHVAEVIPNLAQTHTLMLITKGDLFDQEAKVARSGLLPCFKYIEVVSDKTIETYHTLFTKYQIPPHRFLMIGDSLRSDILPVISAGGTAVYIPSSPIWQHELINDSDLTPPVYVELAHMGLLPPLIKQLCCVSVAENYSK